MVAFMAKLKLTNTQIKEFAEANDIGNDIFINLRTNEVIELPKILNGPTMEFSEYHTDDIEKVEVNWHEIEKIECPDSRESFEIMASFVDELPEQNLKITLAKALNQKRPFRKFNQIIHNCELIENWFKHKSNMLELRVIKILNEIKIATT
jgi:hypothetical protein